jgi:hypothetical protein
VVTGWASDPEKELRTLPTGLGTFYGSTNAMLKTTTSIAVLTETELQRPFLEFVQIPIRQSLRRNRSLVSIREPEFLEAVVG